MGASYSLRGLGLVRLEQGRKAEARGLLQEALQLRREAMLPSGAAALAEQADSAILGVARSAELSQVRLVEEDLRDGQDLFPEGVLDQDLQQVDLRDRNSWRLLLHEVSSVELLETQLVNAVAPFVLNGRLKPLMLGTPERDKHIVNVSAVEGSSTGSSRRLGNRTPTWPRPR